MNVDYICSNNGRQIYMDNQDVESFSNAMNENLLKIEKELFSKYDVPNERKSILGSDIFDALSHIELKLKEIQVADGETIKDLQILKVKYGIAAIKCGDTDWESFGLAMEVYHNNESFIKSGQFRLSATDLIIQKITEEQRKNYLICCQYNFAHNLAYNKNPAPGDKNQESFYTYFSTAKKYNVSEEIATAIANSTISKNICEASFEENPEMHKDKLFIVLKELNEFYDDYLKCESRETDSGVKLRAQELASWQVCLPEKIKQQLLN